jgi:hypothetical protein
MTHRTTWGSATAGRPISDGRTETRAAERWLPAMICLAIGAFALGSLASSLLSRSGEPILVSAAPTFRTPPALVVAVSAAPPIAEAPRANVDGRGTESLTSLWSGLQFRWRPAAWSGDMRAFLRHALIWLHGPKRHAVSSARYFQPTPASVLEMPPCDVPAEFAGEQRAATSPVLVAVERADCTLASQE